MAAFPTPYGTDKRYVSAPCEEMLITTPDPCSIIAVRAANAVVT